MYIYLRVFGPEHDGLLRDARVEHRLAERILLELGT